MLVPVVVPPITVQFPDPSTFNLVLSYFNDIVSDVFKKGFGKVKLFYFVLKIVVDVACKFDIFNDEYDDKLFRLLLIPLIFKKL